MVAIRGCLLACCLLWMGLAATPALAAAPAPYGAHLFTGAFAATPGNAGSTDTPLTPGDRVVVRLWNGINFDGELTVAPDGSLPLPEGLGALPVAGLPAAALPQALQSKLASQGRQGVEAYIAPLDTRLVQVFVTGEVARPGRYAGHAHDPVLLYLDKAGGIGPGGSYRHIRLVRQGREVAHIDLYPFARKGDLPLPRLREGDTLVVAPRGISVAATGLVRHEARFEFAGRDGDDGPSGKNLLALCLPAPEATHVTLKGTRGGAPHTIHLPLTDFARLRLEDGDSLTFVADTSTNALMVTLEGAVKGSRRLPLQRGARLRDALNFVAVEPGRANLHAIHLKRKSVAARQRRALEDSLRRLEEAALTASSASAEEAQIRGSEAQMIAKFVERARSVEPEGVVVLERQPDGSLPNPLLEEGDVIVIPEKSDVVVVSGEVLMPQAVVWGKGKDVDAYVRACGGYSPRADRGNALLARPDGSVIREHGDIAPGDQILVLPRVETKGMQLVKDVALVLFQVATSCRLVLGVPL